VRRNEVLQLFVLQFSAVFYFVFPAPLEIKKIIIAIEIKYVCASNLVLFKFIITIILADKFH
jgi:hypothetical protein